MIALSIDDKQIEVPDGSTILAAAEKLGIEIPTLCFLKDIEATTSCMLCVVKVEGKRGLVPACATLVAQDMNVTTLDEDIRTARRTALELLLSDHLGDCMGPCQTACPAHMDIPLMIRQIAAGQFDAALRTVKATIALPAVLGRICPAPCEKVCRRAQQDEAVSICLLKRIVADIDLDTESPWQAQTQGSRDKRVAIVGAGPAGLACAYYLQQAGYACTVFDEHELAGGRLREDVPETDLPHTVLDAEIEQIMRLGVHFQGNTYVGRDVSLSDLRGQFDAVYLAIGRGEDTHEEMGLPMGPKGFKVDRHTHQTPEAGVFAGGDAVRGPSQRAIRSLADGREAAISIGQYLAGETVTGPEQPFNIRMGRLQEKELQSFLALASHEPRQSVESPEQGFTSAQARDEALRCLHCDCRKPRACKLRHYSQVYGAQTSQYKAERRKFSQSIQHPDLIYEPGKCIACGLCIKITAQQAEDLGLTFVGRGFDIRVAVPLDKTMHEALQKTAQACTQACPTGALVLRGS